MEQTNLRILITGVALFIFGPVIGYVLTMTGLFQVLYETPPPGDLQAAAESFGLMPKRVSSKLIPVLIGSALGATGLFMIALSFIRHFLAAPTAAATAVPRPGASGHVITYPAPAKSAPHTAVEDDSRYMPKT